MSAKSSPDPVLRSLRNLQKEVTVPLQAKKTLSSKELQALHDHIQRLYKLYEKQQNQLLHLTHDTDKVEPFSLLEHLTNQSNQIFEQLNVHVQKYTEATALAGKAIADTQVDLQAEQKTLDEQQVEITKIEEELKRKLQVAATRDRMLQLSQERNIYKKKIIYVLLAIVIALITTILASYNFFSKK